METIGIYEALMLLPKIRARKMEKYKMDLLITHSGKPEKMLKELDRIDSVSNEKTDSLDVGSFERFKQALSKSRAIVIK